MKTADGPQNLVSVPLNRAAQAVHTRFGAGRRIIIRAVEIFLRPLTWVLRTRPAPPPDQVRAILVLIQGYLGDLVLLTPFLQSLRARFPDAHIALIGRSGLKDLLDVQNLANELIPIEMPWAVGLPRWRVYIPFSLRSIRFLRDLLRLRRRDFDWGFVSSLGDIRSNFALFLTGARRRIAYDFAGGGLLLTDAVQPDLLHVHHAELSLRLLEYVGVPAVPPRRLLSLDREDARFAQEFMERNGIEEGTLLVGIHPNAGPIIKEWGEERFQALAEQVIVKFGAKVVWFSDPGRPPKTNGSNPNIVYAALPLRQFLAVLSRCHTLVGNDSGPTHMAAGLGVPVVAIFGPEQPEWYHPLGEGHQIVIRQPMWCRPCWRRCKFAEPYCLRLISVEEVMQSVSSVVKDWTRESRPTEVRT